MPTSSIGWLDTSWPSTTNAYALNWTGNTTTTTIVNVTWVSANTNYGFHLLPQTGNYQVTGNYVTGVSPVRVKTAAEIIAEEMAEKASQQLVRDLVGDAQYELFKKLGYVEIDSKARPGTVYRIKRDAVDLFEKKDGKIIDLKQWLCVHPRPLDKGIYPEGDQVATRILLARFAEDDLWKTANLHHKAVA